MRAARSANTLERMACAVRDSSVTSGYYTDRCLRQAEARGLIRRVRTRGVLAVAACVLAVACDDGERSWE